MIRANLSSLHSVAATSLRARAVGIANGTWECSRG